MSGLATDLADSQPRESGVNALRDIDSLYGNRMMSPSPEPPRHQQQPYESYDMSDYATPQRPPHQSSYSQSSIAPLMANRDEQPRSAPSPERGQHGYAAGAAPMLYGGPANRAPYHSDGYDDAWDPRDFADDDDDFPPERSRGGRKKYGAAAAGGGAGAAAGAGMFRNLGPRDPSGTYGPVGAAAGRSGDPEKSAWMQKQSNGKRRWKWIIGLIAAALVIAGVVVGVLFGVVFNDESDSDSSSGSSSTSPSSTSSSALYDKDSKEIKALMNNPDLHKVFPGMDYTPHNAQYPDCLHNPPDQNNITIDMAILSQLTPAVRLYGTDCNQTEMVLEAINRLDLADTLKVWLGVWLDANTTSTTRQVNQAHDLLDNYPSKHWAGVIVGNEVLYAEYMTITELGKHMNDFRSDLQQKGISDIPVATADLGDDWTAGLAGDSDIVMANVHPFFAGVAAGKAAGWTWDFWQNNNVPLTPAASSGGGGYPKHIVAETGWPTAGGNNCGTGEACPNETDGSVAGIDELNIFMEDWVCPGLRNGTSYFWFSAFDEPWKVSSTPFFFRSPSV